jgi:TolC family type I secretion outer membrane protein
MCKIGGLIVTIIAALITSAAVQGAQLEQLLPELISTNEVISAAQQRRDRAADLLRAERGDYLPQLDITANIGPEYVNRVDDTDTDLVRKFIEARATQLITDFGSTSGRIDRAATSLNREEKRLEAVRQDVMLNGIIAYLEIIRAEKTYTFARQSEASIKRQTGMEETMVQRGAGLSSDVLQAKSQLAGARARVVTTRTSLAEAYSRFKAVFGFDGEDMGSSFSVPEGVSLPMPESLSAAVATALLNNPSLSTAQLNIDIAKQDITINRARYFPRLDIFGEATHRDDYLGIEGDRDEAVIGIELTYNLYNGGSDVARVRAATKQAVERLDLLKEEQKLLEEAIANAWNDLLAARQRYDYLSDQADIVGEFLELARRERKLGKRSLLDVLAGEINHLDALSNAEAAGIDIHTATYRLLHAMGMLKLDIFQS